MKRKLLVGLPGFSDTCREAKELLLNNGFSVDENPYGRTFAFDELKDIIGDYTAMISELEIWDERLFNLAKQMKIISRNGVGLDNIDLDAAKRANVAITYAKGVNAVSVANMAIALMLSALRKIPYLDRTTKAGQWKSSVQGNDLDGRIVGFLGFGGIAQQVAKRLKGFDVNMIAFDKYPNREAARKYNVEIADMDEVLRASDIVSLHLPYCDETHHIINDARFHMMKKNAILINTARGKLVDENALYTALSGNAISGAAIDVYETEPVDPNNRLLTLDNLICTPHLSGNTAKACSDVGLQVARDIVAFFNGEIPKLLVR